MKGEATRGGTMKNKGFAHIFYSKPPRKKEGHFYKANFSFLAEKPLK